MLVGFILAFGAAFAYSGASLLQSVGARGPLHTPVP